VKARFILLLAWALPACLEADAERPGYSANVLGAGERVPKAADDEAFAMRLVNNAGAAGPLVPLLTGFANGADALYWDFGVSTSSVEPVWILERKEGEPIDHPPIVDSLPGDDAYSPFRAVFRVQVTAAYAGEQIASLKALEDAIELGLVREPVATGSYVSWPIVPADFALERRDQEPLETKMIYATGVSAHYLPIGGAQPYERSIATGASYALRRQHELAPLDEAAGGANLNADGDQLDSNLIFEVAADEAPSGLWSLTEVVVERAYVFGTYRAHADLFPPETDAMELPDAGASDAGTNAFIELTETEDPVYRPLYATEMP
jgi:hypothetical protein